MTAGRPRRRARPAADPNGPAPPKPADGVPMRGSPRPHPWLGLGLWALGRWDPDDEARTREVVAHAVERGVAWFDTAEVYGLGRSERILGEALAAPSSDRPTPFVVTKASWEHLRPAQLRAALHQSLERLGRRSVDLYLLHGPDPRVPLAETIPALEALWKGGQTGAIGVSNFSVEELEEAARHLTDGAIAVNQIRYSLLDRDDAEPIREYCQRHGILVEAYSPLARGLLCGRYLDGRRVPTAVRRFAHRFFEGDRWPMIRDRALRLRELARRHELPLASIALHWLARQGALPVFGASRPAQVDENLAAWSVRPPDEVLDEADRIARGDAD